MIQHSKFSPEGEALLVATCTIFYKQGFQNGLPYKIVLRYLWKSQNTMKCKLYRG